MALAAEDDRLHSSAEAMGDHQGHVHDEEEHKARSQEVHAPCRLWPEQLGQAREARSQRRRHPSPVKIWSGVSPNEKEVSELLERL